MAPNAKDIFAPILEKFQWEQREREREKLNNLRQLEIGQEVKKFQSPASKRAVFFLLESKNVTTCLMMIPRGMRRLKIPKQINRRDSEAERAAARLTRSSSSRLYDDD